RARAPSFRLARSPASFPAPAAADSPAATLAAALARFAAVFATVAAVFAVVVAVAAVIASAWATNERARLIACNAAAALPALRRNPARVSRLRARKLMALAAVVLTPWALSTSPT